MLGLNKMAAGAKTIAVADSVNDLPLLAGADYAFAPSNVSSEALRKLEEQGFRIQPLPKSSISPDAKTIYLAAHSETRGVIDILAYLNTFLTIGC